jgi:hypothetical protein
MKPLESALGGRAASSTKKWSASVFGLSLLAAAGLGLFSLMAGPGWLQSSPGSTPPLLPAEAGKASGPTPLAVAPSPRTSEARGAHRRPADNPIALTQARGKGPSPAGVAGSGLEGGVEASPSPVSGAGQPGGKGGTGAVVPPPPPPASAAPAPSPAPVAVAPPKTEEAGASPPAPPVAIVSTSGHGNGNGHGSRGGGHVPAVTSHPTPPPPPIARGGEEPARAESSEPPAESAEETGREHGHGHGHLPE